MHINYLIEKFSFIHFCLFNRYADCHVKSIVAIRKYIERFKHG